MTPPAIVAIPVRDEAARIGACLRALAGQRGGRLAAIVLLVNNTRDRTEAVVAALRPRLAVPVHLLVRTLRPELACAGVARRMAMEHALALLGGDGVLLTTDADGTVPPDWVAANLRHIAAGVEAVAGRAVLCPEDEAAIPERLRDDDALECAYAAALDEIASLLDPDPWDPWPRHAENPGASIAVTATAYVRAGGMPPVPLAEDRRFFDALRRTDARIRHAPEIAVQVSGRLVGRAPGGMADTISRRLLAPDPYLDGALEPAAAATRRAAVHGLFRRAWHGGTADHAAASPVLQRALAADPAMIAAAFRARYCGEGWAGLEADSALGPRRPVRACAAARELDRATALLARLRRCASPDDGAAEVLDGVAIRTVAGGP